MSVQFFAAGIPVPQGSMRAFVQAGRPVLTSTAKGLGLWRETIRGAAQPFAGLIEGGIAVELTFYLPRPKSLPRSRIVQHAKRPDLDKLIRAALDALTGVLWHDDAQVCCIWAAKLYAAPDARIGVRVVVSPAGLPDPESRTKQEAS